MSRLKGGAAHMLLTLLKFHIILCFTVFSSDYVYHWFISILPPITCSINMLIPPQKTIFELEEEEEKAVEIQRWQERRRRASIDQKRVI
jgi:hypothetical protein